jgi:hypothetical protein
MIPTRPESLRLSERLDATASSRHIEAGRNAFANFEKIRSQRLRRVSSRTGKDLEPRRLFTMVSVEVFDRYGRLLAYVAPSYTKEERETIPQQKRPTFNLQTVQDGHATPLLIYPNIPKAADLKLLHNAVVKARAKKRGLWSSEVPVLQASEFRWIVDTVAGKRDGPDRFCGDFGTAALYPPQHYTEVPLERRVWLYKERVGAAMQMGFELQV